MRAGPHQRVIALCMVAVLLIAFVVSAPFASRPLGRSAAFIPSYETALFVEDLITAALLYAQFTILRYRSLLLLATAYLFTALIVVPHMLVFPGLFAPTGLLGAGVGSAAWIYVFWHVGFPVALIAYALEHPADRNMRVASGKTHREIAACALGALALVAVLTWIATAGEPLLPRVMDNATERASRFPYLTGSVWLLTAVALATLWTRRRQSVIDLWLAVVLFVWLCEIALSVVLAPSRFSVGFYLGRLYGIIAASIVLIGLLSETTVLYAQLARAIATERRERERRFAEMEAMLSHLSRV